MEPRRIGSGVLLPDGSPAVRGKVTGTANAWLPAVTCRRRLLRRRSRSRTALRSRNAPFNKSDVRASRKPATNTPPHAFASSRSSSSSARGSPGCGAADRFAGVGVSSGRLGLEQQHGRQNQAGRHASALIARTSNRAPGHLLVRLGQSVRDGPILRQSTVVVKQVAQIFPKWNPLTCWMRQIEDVRKGGQGPPDRRPNYSPPALARAADPESHGAIYEMPCVPEVIRTNPGAGRTASAGLELARVRTSAYGHAVRSVGPFQKWTAAWSFKEAREAFSYPLRTNAEGHWFPPRNRLIWRHVSAASKRAERRGTLSCRRACRLPSLHHDSLPVERDRRARSRGTCSARS